MDKNRELLPLLERAQQRDQVAFGELYQLHFDRIYKFIFFRVGSEAIAEDLAAEVFLKAWRMMPKYAVKKDAKFSTWLFTIAKNIVIDHYRVQKKDISIDQVTETAEPQSRHNEVLDGVFELETVNLAMRKLKPEYASIIDLRYFQQFEYDEISKILKKSEVAVRVLLHRAIKALKSELNYESQSE